MKKVLTGACALLAVALGAGAQAIVIFDTSFEFSNGTAPAGPKPWTRTTIQNAGANTVTIKLENLNLVGSEFDTEVSMNLDPLLDPGALVFSLPVKVGTFDLPSISTGKDAFKADGDGYFDIQFNFATANSKRFGAGESVSYTVTGIVGLDETDFAFPSVGGSAGKNGFPVAYHVQGIGTSGSFSGWVTTPEPGSIAALVFGGAALLMRRARKD